MNFYLINNTQWPVSEEFVGWLLNGIARELPKDKKAMAKYVGVVVASLPQMIDLNGHFRRKKGATDVLSFEGGGHEGIGEFENGGFLGDVVICYEVCSQQAKDHGLDEAEEFAYLLLHGILHLLGYEHETKKSDALIMFAIQDKIFEKLMDQDIFKAYRKLSGSRNGKKAQPGDSLQRNEESARKNGRKGRRPAEVSLTSTPSSSSSKSSATNRKTRKSGATPSSSKKSTKRSPPSKKSARSGKI